MNIISRTNIDKKLEEARSAAESAESTAWSACSAADSAAWSARSAAGSAAWSAANSAEKKKQLQMIKERL